MTSQEAPPDARDLEALIQDEDFERLEDIAQEFNVFEVLGAVSQEIRHSNFLAWILDPLAIHGLGEYFLKRFLWKIAGLAREQGIESLSPIDVDALDLAQVSVRREWRGIDLLLLDEGQGFICAIENKVEAGEHGDQLRRYARTCRTEFPNCAHHLIFLSASGIEPSEPGWVAVNYDHLLNIVDRTLITKRRTTSDEVALFLQHYANMLRRHIVGASEIEELCEWIYLKHRQALDMLFEHRPDTRAEIRRILEELILVDPDFELDDRSIASHIHFAPRSWNSDELRHAGSNSRRILTFMFQNGPDSLRLYLEIQPGDQAVRSRIHEVARGSPIFSAQPKLYPKFARIFKRDFLRPPDYEQPLDWIESQIKLRLRTFKENGFPEIDEVIRGIRFG